MKKLTVLVLALALFLSAGTAFADNSVLRQDDSFQLAFDNLNRAEGHVMALSKGDEFYLSETITGGSVHVLVRMEGGRVLYDSNEIPPVGYTITIPEDGVYRFSVTGENASGIVWISQRSKLADDASAMPETLQYAQSDLGYAIQYDTATFAFAKGVANGNDSGTDVLQNASGDAVITVSRIPAHYNDTVQQLMDQAAIQPGLGALTEKLPAVINFRAARVLERIGAGDRAGITEHITVFDAGENETLVVRVNYPTNEAGVGQKMQNMVENMIFTY